MAVKQSSDMT